MKKGNLSSVTLAVSLVFGSNTIAANPCIEKSTEFKESKNYSVDYANTVRSKRADQLVRIKIDPKETLTLQNTNNRSKSSVVKSETEAGIAFSGGNLILQKSDDSTDYGNSDFYNRHFIRVSEGALLSVDTQRTLMEGSVARGVVLSGAGTFTRGFTMNVDRSTIAVSPQRTFGADVRPYGSLNTKFADITMTAGVQDPKMNGIRVWHGGRFSAESLSLQLNGSGSKNLEFIDALYVGQGDESKYKNPAEQISVSGPIRISIQDASNARGCALALLSNRDYSIAGKTDISVSKTKTAYGLYAFHRVNVLDELTMDFRDNTEAIGIRAASEADVTAKAANIQMSGGITQAVYLKNAAKVTVTDSLTTNASQALVGIDNSAADIQKDFVTLSQSEISAENDARIYINSTKKGLVQFSGNTRISDNGTIAMHVSSGTADKNAYWNITDRSQLTELSAAPGASLNFLLTPALLSSLGPDEAVVSVKGSSPVLLHSDAGKSSCITLSGAALNLKAGDEIRLINSSNGIALNDLTNRLAAGTSVSELKRDLNVESVKSLARVEKSELTQDDYDLSMKTEQMLIAKIKNRRPSKDKVNDQTNVLMLSSLSSAAALFAADELLIDSTLKSRKGTRQPGPFAAARVGGYELDVRGDLDETIVSGLLGYAFKLQQSEVGAFLEMGRGTYDARSPTTSPIGHVKGDGKNNYVGVGIYGNCAAAVDWLHFTGYVKGGMIRSEFDVPIAGVKAEFDRTSAYWGAHAGAYGEFQLTKKLKNRTFLNYFYDGREGESYKAAGSSEVSGATFHFNSLNAHRGQLGTLMEYQYDRRMHPYAALTYEYAFKADAKGHAQDRYGTLVLNEADLEGSTGIASLGWTYQDYANTFDLSIGLNAYTGVRKGYNTQAHASWKF